MKVKWVLLSLIFLLTSFCDSVSSDFIAVNLTGYSSDDNKQAFLVNADANEFEVVHSADDQVAYSGFIWQQKKPDKATGDTVSLIDFSELTEPGEYYIRIAENPEIRSHSFKIDENVYSEVTSAVLQSYYYHRCGTEVDNGEQWTYEVCHLDDAPFYDYPEIEREVTGGWHDAGDYNKFTVNTAVSVGLLLHLYELEPAAFTDAQLNIPESGNGIPDLLDEVKWALEWMLKMQRQDGAVFHKVSQKKWTGEYLPHEDPETRYIFDISSSATATFTAVAALGAKLFEDHDSEYAKELANAAFNSWHYLEEHPYQQPRGGFENPPDVHGGSYGDPDDSDERIWAAIELFKLTGDEKFIDFFVTTFRDMDQYFIPALSWKNFESLAYSSFIHMDTQHHYSGIKDRVRKLFITHANTILNKRETNNYLNLIDTGEYYWGSNSVGLAYSFDLIQAFRLTNEKEYKTAALDQLHYVLGRNPFNMSQVTAVGTRSSQKPYHQLSEMGGFDEPIPGMLVGGPNNHLHLNDKEISPFPGKNYEDRFKNYLVNETAINYTAVLAYVSGYFSSKSGTEITGNR
ncbi:MAG: glycoside hydrolase family 9 protein [Balneolaceae bacterium]